MGQVAEVLLHNSLYHKFQQALVGTSVKCLTSCLLQVLYSQRLTVQYQN